MQDTLGNLPMITTGRGALSPVRPASRHRELKSDFLLVKVGPLEWLPFRDVYEVDGTPIRDREGRLAAFPPPDRNVAGAGQPNRR
mgnify:CR=1 FL=1